MTIYTSDCCELVLRISCGFPEPRAFSGIGNVPVNFAIKIVIN